MSNKIMTRFTYISRLVLNEILASLRWQASKARATFRASRDYGSSLTRFLRPVGSKRAELERRFIASLLMMLVLGVRAACGTDITSVAGLAALNGSNGSFVIKNDIDASSGFSTIDNFSGTLEADINPTTKMPYRIKNLSAPLFTTLTGTVKNLVIENVNITSGTDVGAIACNVKGTSDKIAVIYNCGILSGSVNGTGGVGGLVGVLGQIGNNDAAKNNCYARVINCYSFADINGGAHKGGIVGYNAYKTTKNDRRSMVMNCMFYGNIVKGDKISPIYAGENIVNKDGTGVGNFNYFRAEAPYAQNRLINVNNGNSALMAETRFLQRFEFFRHLLNGHRELAAWWATGDVDNKDQMLKWVMEPSQIGSTMPYPVLKEPGKYPSVVNYAPSDVAIDDKNEHRNEGRKLTNMGGTGENAGKLAVTIEMGSGGEQFGPPTGAAITESSLSLTITDKDPAHFNFNYGKVQLPYYNDVGTKNYHKASDSDNTYRVVVGWKITSITGGTPGTLSIPANDNTPADAPYYNYADRNCTNKDLYSVSGRVFNQGDYWDVPEGVKAITIQPYWAKAAYVADNYRDVVYNTGMTTAYNVETVGGGQWFTNGNSHDFTFKGETLSLKVYNTISNAATALTINNSHTVNDYAVVLVGNHHYYGGTNKAIGGSKVPYTVMSADFDCDNEPDYSLIMRFDGRAVTHPVKYDFLCMPGFGMAQKSTGGTGSYNFGIPKPDGWFEVTNTALFRVTQMEYSPSSREKKPIILHGGVIEQWVSSQGAGNSSGDAGDRVSYFHMGDNVWFKEFHIGVHQDYPNPTPHPPVSVTGGDYEEFALTGLYRADANHYNDNAECYINGGRFGKVYGAGCEGIGDATNKTNGNITWQIDNADIDEFYGGGINFAHTAQGNISTTISNSYVGVFCGGPKFGDMNEERTVVTNATNCTFGTYFGAGYGGNSYNRQVPKNYSSNNLTSVEWNKWIKGEVNAGDGFGGYKQEYNSSYNGVSTQFNYQFIPMSGNAGNVGRLFVEFVGFSLATTHNVTSNLTGCTITGNFYGGGSLGKVDGTVTSTLDDCKVEGNVFGAGYSASLPTVEVDSIGFRTEPLYYTEFGTYRTGIKGKTTTYTWEQGNAISVDNTNHILYTTEDLTKLGTVTGDVKLKIEGTSEVKGNVYGGGEESSVEGDTEVKMTNGTIGNGTSNAEHGNVFGGGKGKADSFECRKAMVGVENSGVTGSGTAADPYVLQSGGTTVAIENGTVNGNVYGGGEVGRVEKNTNVTIGKEGETGSGSKPDIKGSVFGAGAGKATHGYSALVRGNTEVTIQGIAKVGGNVYGGGEIASVGRFEVVGGLPAKPKSGGTCTVTILGNSKIGSGDFGNVFGSCKGVEPTYSYTTSSSYNDRLNNSKCMQTYANKPEGDEGETWDYYIDENGNKDESFVWEYFDTKDKYLAFLKTLALASHPTVTITGTTTVNGSVYGGGQRGITLGDVNVNITSGTVKQDVYGGGALADTNKGNWDDTEFVKVTGLPVGHTITDLYTITGGTGSAADPYIYSETTDETVVENKDYYSKGNWASGKYTYNSEKKIYETTYKTNVTLTGGTIKGNVYGGGLGQIGRAGEDAVGTEGEDGYKPAVTAIEEVKAKVFGDVLVTLNRTKTAVKTGEGAEATTTYTYASDGTCVVQGDIFGCNNQNGSPQSAVTVHIFRTQGWDGHDVTEGKNDATKEKTGTTYELSAVYGGGNLSAFYPDLKATRDTIQTHVIIDGCALTSIEQVYGGGNAASTPATNLTINSVYEIGEVFGGGNGLKDITVNGVTQKNPGANVGYTAYHTDYDPPASSATERTTKFSYGSGKASVNIYGGTIHYVFGGSNTKGNVRQTAITLLDNQDPCVLDIDEAYGGGRSAPMDAEAKLLMACIPGLKAAYGGAQAADVQNNVVLNITNGTFDRVFGGNNLSGTISGSITVNIEETGCVPLIIGELYGGGNLAPYSVYGYDNNKLPIQSGTKKWTDPQINVKSFTSIGNIYGGGYGTGAVLYGDPTVNINVTEGKYYDRTQSSMNSTDPNYSDYDANGYKGTTKTIDGHAVIIPRHDKDKIGAIQNVFGGGNAAAVVGSTRVNVGTTSKEYVTVPDNDIKVGETIVSTLYTCTGEGTSGSPYVYALVGKDGTGADKKAEEGITYYKECEVKGADIRGNVYGGGNQADVTGSTNVTIGKETTTTP